MNRFNEDNQTGENHEGTHPNKPTKFLTASSIIGDKVINPQQENLGYIKDIMINVVTGKIEYVVMELGGFLGIGEKLFAIPFQLLELNAKKQLFVFDQSKETIEKAPGFNKDHWPETNNHMINNSQAYWGGFMGANTGGVPF